jgi:hypothetical protein
MKQIEVSPFLQIKVEQTNWTGYNAILVDKVADLGITLQEENKNLFDENKSLKKELGDNDRSEFFEGFGAIVGIGLTVIFCVGLLSAAIFGIGKWSRHDKSYSEGFNEASIAAVTFVEARYRGVKPEEIKLDFSQYGQEK